MSHRVVHFEVVGKDAALLQNFYRDAFGWKVEPAAPGYAMVHTEGGINGGVGAAPEGSPGHVTFYVETDDLHAALRSIESLGGHTVAEPMDIPGGPSIAMFTDPEGHLVGLVKSESRQN